MEVPTFQSLDHKLGGPMSTATSLEQPTLNAADRCDRCGAQAYVRAVLPSGGQLYFCAHHARQVEDNLRPGVHEDRKSTRLNSSHVAISYAVFCLKKKNSIQFHNLILYSV